MGNLIVLREKDVRAKGLNKCNQIDENKLKEYFFEQDYNNLELLNKIDKIELQTETPTLFYPGSGADIFFPIKYFEKLFPNKKEANFIFLDLYNFLNLIKTQLDEVNINFEEHKNNVIKFYWNNLLINLKFIKKDVFNYIHDLEKFDIYFEKAFRIMKEIDLEYENKVFNKLNKNGVIISDSGYSHLNLNKLPISSKLSSYNEMILGIKESD